MAAFILKKHIYEWSMWMTSKEKIMSPIFLQSTSAAFSNNNTVHRFTCLAPASQIRMPQLWCHLWRKWPLKRCEWKVADTKWPYACDWPHTEPVLVPVPFQMYTMALTKHYLFSRRLQTENYFPLMHNFLLLFCKSLPCCLAALLEFWWITRIMLGLLMYFPSFFLDTNSSDEQDQNTPWDFAHQPKMISPSIFDVLFHTSWNRIC